MFFQSPFKKPQESWKNNKDGVVLLYPIFHHDPLIPDSPNIKLTIEDVCGDIDFWGWQWEAQERIVDSLGQVFLSGYEKSGIHESGVFPGKIEKIMEIDEIKKLMILGIEAKFFAQKEDKQILLHKIAHTDNIQHILLMCGKFL